MESSFLHDSLNRLIVSKLHTNSSKLILFIFSVFMITPALLRVFGSALFY